jgi:mRNA interferase RelE/StbE
MTWTVSISKRAQKDISKLDAQSKLKLNRFIIQELPYFENPRINGKALQGNLKGLWRYRVGDYRLICQIQDGELTILVVQIGHRKEIYT